jgi:hypothetical protein
MRHLIALGGMLGIVVLCLIGFCMFFSKSRDMGLTRRQIRPANHENVGTHVKFLK